jgi:hypothetical protein
MRSWKNKFNIWTLDEVEMSAQICTYNGDLHRSRKKKKQSYFKTVLGHVVEAQCLQEPCQLLLQNWQNQTFHSTGR